MFGRYTIDELRLLAGKNKARSEEEINWLNLHGSDVVPVPIIDLVISGCSQNDLDRFILYGLTPNGIMEMGRKYDEYGRPNRGERD